MSQGWPKILETRTTVFSPWLTILAKNVQLHSNSPIETYYAIGEPDYVAVLAVTPQDEILFVRQYRPAIARFSLELPAGLVEPNEEPAVAATRELLEETGYAAESFELIGVCATSAGRISNSTYSFFVRTGAKEVSFIEEPGTSVHAYSLDELRDLILSGEFCEQSHMEHWAWPWREV